MSEQPDKNWPKKGRSTYGFPPLQSRRSGYSAISKAKGQISGPAPQNQSLKGQQLKPLSAFYFAKCPVGRWTELGNLKRNCAFCNTLKYKEFPKDIMFIKFLKFEILACRILPWTFGVCPPLPSSASFYYKSFPLSHTFIFFLLNSPTLDSHY